MILLRTAMLKLTKQPKTNKRLASTSKKKVITKVLISRNFLFHEIFYFTKFFISGDDEEVAPETKETTSPSRGGTARGGRGGRARRSRGRRGA